MKGGTSTGPASAVLTAAGQTSAAAFDQLTGTGVPVEHLYWANIGAFPNTGTIMEANLDGTGVTTLVNDNDIPHGVAVDSSHLCWSDTKINQANLDGTNPHSIVSGLNFGLAELAVGPQ